MDPLDSLLWSDFAGVSSICSRISCTASQCSCISTHFLFNSRFTFSKLATYIFIDLIFWLDSRTLSSCSASRWLRLYIISASLFIFEFRFFNCFSYLALQSHLPLAPPNIDSNSPGYEFLSPDVKLAALAPPPASFIILANWFSMTFFIF